MPLPLLAVPLAVKIGAAVVTAVGGAYAVKKAKDGHNERKYLISESDRLRSELAKAQEKAEYYKNGQRTSIDLDDI
jgi:hypothetical protein